MLGGGVTMLQRPSIKLPKRRLSQLTTPTKSTRPSRCNSENVDTSNQPLSPMHIESNHQVKTPSPSSKNILSDLLPPQHNEPPDTTADEPYTSDFVESNIKLKNAENIQCMVRVRPLLSEVESRGRIVVVGDSKTNMISIDCKPN